MKYELELDIKATNTDTFFVTISVTKNRISIISIDLSYQDFKRLFISGVLQELKTAYNVCVFNDEEARYELIDTIKRELS